MKKKFKLFATIGSLALAICMMTIGVLAAAQVSLTVTSSVTFGATSTYVDFEANVSGGNLESAKTLKAKNYSTTSEASEPNFTASEGQLSSDTWSIGEIKFVENSDSNSDGQTIVYKFTIKNPLAEGGAGLKVVITPTIPSDIVADTAGNSTSDAADYTVTYQKQKGASAATTATITDLDNVPAGDSVIITYTLTLNNVAASLTGGTVSFKFDFSRVATAA